MASAAVALKQRGHHIIGSDTNIYPPMSDFLVANGIEILPGYREQNLQHLKPDLVVIGNALSRGNPEVEYVLNEHLNFTSLPELLQNFFIRGKKSLVVCGTHGKTTTTSLLAWVFEHNGLNPSYLIGGIPSNFKQGARFTDSPWFIIEGDEYDTAFFDKRSKFIHYCPSVAILNNLEFDHADIFENLNAVKKTFRHLINIVPGNGLVLFNGDDPNLREITQSVTFCPTRKFGFAEGNDFQAVNRVCLPQGLQFTLGENSYSLPLTGDFNIRNALGVTACALHCGLTPAQIQSAFQSFKGIRRRMEVVGSASGVTVMDDFGHHPTAIKATVKALKERYPGQRIWAAFEPRSNTTRRNVFQNELVDAFAECDGVVIGAVAREDQLPAEIRLNVPRLTQQIQATYHIPAAHFDAVSDVIPWIVSQTHSGDIVCVFSNGQFGNIHKLLLAALDQK